MSPDAMMMVQNGAAKESSYRGEKARVQKSTSLRVPSPMPLLETRVASPMPSAVYTRAKETNVAAASHVVKQAQQFLEANVKAWMQPNGQEIPGAVPECSLTPMTSVGISHHALLEHNQSYGSFTQGGPSFYPLYPPSPYTSPYYLPYGQPPNAQQASAAASFFARAAQKLNLSSRKKRRHHLPPDPEPPPFVTNFNAILQESPPAAPPALLRSVGRRDNVGLGKVKVMLRITPTTKDGDHSSSFLSLDSRKKQVTVFDPSVCGYVTPEDRRAGVAAPKMFAFDAVFSQDDSQTEVCCTALTDVIQAVVNGNDGCLFCYGHSKLGKTYTMIGNSGSVQTIGAIPCAISWLFKLINEQKQKTGARFSVRVSAVEISGKNETLKDLLSEQANGTENSGTSPGIYLREDPIFGAQLQNQSELRVPTVEKAAYYLDAAITARTNDIEDEGRNSHMLFTLHVYQYRVDKSGKGGVAGGRSRLHLLDLGSCDKQGKGSSLTLSAMANVILAILYGQKHVPFRDSKLTQLLREILGSLSCNAAMIAHVSPSMINYSETLSTIQFAARIHRLRRKKLKYSSQSSGESSCDDIRVRKHLSREDGIRSSSDPDHTSSSEQSCDTVIYVGPNGTSLSDRELTDNESPPVALPIASKHIPKSTAFKTKLHPTSFLGETPIKEIMKNSDSQVDHSTSVMNGKESSENDISKKETRAQESSHSGDQNRSNSVSTNRKSGKSNSRRSSSSKSKHSGLQGNAEKHSSSPSRMMLRTYSPLPMSHLPGNSVGPKSALWSMDSEEQWIDGPRVRKAWFEAQSTLHRQEMWVDGPPPMYGYMDKHKREMIQRWLDFQSSHVQRLAKEENEVWIDGRDENSHPKREKHERKDIDLHGTNLKCNSAKPSGLGTVSGNPQDLVSTCINEDRNISSVLNFPENIQIKDEKFKYFSNGFVNYSEADISKNLALAFDSSKQTEETLLKISHPPLQNSHTDYSEIHSNKINDGAEEPLLYSEEEEEAGSDLEADMMYNHRVERCEPHNLDPLLEESEEDLSPEEPIMQDSCLQVTEEDILAACMEFNEDHPLRILSEENLASSFADTFSVDTDLRTPSFQESESEAEDDGHLDDIPPCATIKLENMSHYSLPVYAMHFSFPKIVNQWTEIGEEENSICSEPAPYGYKQIQPRTLKSTHTNITTVFQNPASGKWNIQEMIQVTSSLESKFIKTDEVCAQADSIPLKTNQYKDLEELSCLRHPDGASNPNLHEELLHVNTELPKISKEHRSPGNGASNSDAEDKACTRCSCSYTINQDHNLAKESQCFTEFKPENEPQCSSPRQSQLSRLFGKKTCCSSEKTHSSGCKSFHQNTLSDCDSSVKLNYSPKSSPKNSTRFSSRIPVSVKCIKESSNKTKDAHKCNKSPLSSMCLCSRPTSPQSFRKKDEKDSSKTHCKKFCQGTKIPCSDKKHSKRKTKNDICQSSCVKQGQRFIADLNSENSRGSPASEKLGKKGTPVSQHASGTSSGYESMLRDSEGSGSSSDQESASEASDEEDKDKYKGETLNLVADRKEGTLPTSKILNLNDIFELKEYDEEDVERIEKRRMMEETLEIRKHRQRVLHLRMRQEELRRELSAAKNRLMLEPNRWSYDLHVEESMDIDDPSFLEVLERETQILEKRVVACKSHIMMVTCFDANL